MKSMIINGKEVANGRVVKALEALLNGDDSLMRKWDDQFYYVRSEVLGCAYMVRKEFNCLTVWTSYVGPTEFKGGDEVVQELYHPLCILDKSRHEDEHQDVCRDLVNGLIRTGMLCADEYLSDFKED